MNSQLTARETDIKIDESSFKRDYGELLEFSQMRTLNT